MADPDQTSPKIQAGSGLFNVQLTPETDIQQVRIQLLTFLGKSMTD
jgi:hypothetical protein